MSVFRPPELSDRHLDRAGRAEHRSVVARIGREHLCYHERHGRDLAATIVAVLLAKWSHVAEVEFFLREEIVSFQLAARPRPRQTH